MKNKKFKLALIPLLLLLLLIFLKSILFSPSRMIIGTWQQDLDETYSYHHGQKTRTLVLDYTINFISPSQIDTGESYYITNNKFGLKRHFQSGYDEYDVISFTPNKLVIEQKHYNNAGYSRYTYYRIGGQ